MHRRWFPPIANPEPADAIFVFAGRDARKHRGIELWRGGLADRLLLSVGRFEWRRVANLELPDDGGLVDKVESTPPQERHFFIDVRASGASCERVARGRLGTMSEARALAQWIARERVESVLVVSSRAHLPRATFAIQSFLRAPCRLIPIASEPTESIALEALKLAFYVPACLGFRMAVSTQR